MTIVDDYSRYTWIFPLKQKSEVVKILENFVIFKIQTQLGTTIKVIRSDNGTEFFMTNFFINKWIMHQTSCVNISQQNNIIKKKHDHLLNIATALMIQSYLLKIYWSYFIIHVAHIINMLPLFILNNFYLHALILWKIKKLANLKMRYTHYFSEYWENDDG